LVFIADICVGDVSTGGRTRTSITSDGLNFPGYCFELFAVAREQGDTCATFG
jgi:hypothetical protein